MSKKQYHYFYFDEQNDDFANNGIDGQPTPKDWEYLPKSKVYRFFKPIVYYGFLGLCSLGLLTLKQHNKKVLKQIKDKKKGYFIYANHTSWFTDAVSGAKASFPKQTYVIANPDAIYIKGIRWLVKFSGCLPTPKYKTTYCNFINSVNKIYEMGRPIVIYPEAHIWPKYNQIRNFGTVSFDYPARLNAPCFTKTTIYVKKKDGTTKPEIYYDGPFYPNMDLPLKERQQNLRDIIYNQMCSRVSEFNSALDCNYTYTKVNSAEEVRSEIKEIK